MNAEAPRELSQFAFLVGNWQCEAKFMSSDGNWQTFEGAWTGRFILDGYAIADEYRMMDSSGKVIVLGMNFRAYDSAKKLWNIKWLDALTGTWVDLGLEELGGVRAEGRSISYIFKETVAGHTFTRATYTSDSETHFTWRGEKSEDRTNWTEFMVIEATRLNAD